MVDVNLLNQINQNCFSQENIVAQNDIVTIVSIICLLHIISYPDSQTDTRPQHPLIYGCDKTFQNPFVVVNTNAAFPV